MSNIKLVLCVWIAILNLFFAYAGGACNEKRLATGIVIHNTIFGILLYFA